MISKEALPALAQNDIMVGLCVLMLGVVPNRASEPPRSWESFLAGTEDD